MVSGINAEVMPAQWEFQVGPVAAPGPTPTSRPGRCGRVTRRASRPQKRSAPVTPSISLTTGHRIEERRTGRHETCSYREFRYGVSDRGASVRIPWQVHRDGTGLELTRVSGHLKIR